MGENTARGDFKKKKLRMKLRREMGKYGTSFYE